MLLQVLYSVRSGRLLMEQVQYNLLFRWFIGLSMDDSVWVPTVFSKNRQRLIEHGAVLAFFEQVLAQAEQKNWLSKEHFSVDGTLIQAWAGHKSFVPKDDEGGNSDGDGGDGGDFRGRPRGNDTHASKTDPDSRLYRKGKTASELRFIGHTLMENRNGLIVDAVVTQVDGYAERVPAKTMIGKVRQANPEAAITLGADKGYDAAEFIVELRRLKVAPHVAKNTSGRSSAVPDEIAQSAGYGISMQCRKRIKRVTVRVDKAYNTQGFVKDCRDIHVTPHVVQNTKRVGGCAIDAHTTRHPGYEVASARESVAERCFGWGKVIGPMRQVMVPSRAKVDQLMTLTMGLPPHAAAHLGTGASAVRPDGQKDGRHDPARPPKDRAQGNSAGRQAICTNARPTRTEVAGVARSSVVFQRPARVV